MGVGSMYIRLYSCTVIQDGLTWEQVSKAVELANASEAGKHFRFYFYKFKNDEGKHNCFSLLSMPKIYYETMAGDADDEGWYITIPD